MKSHEQKEKEAEVEMEYHQKQKLYYKDLLFQANLEKVKTFSKPKLSSKTAPF